MQLCKVKFSSTGDYIITVGADPYIRLFNFHSKNLEMKFSNLNGYIRDMDINNNDSKIVSISNDNKIYISRILKEKKKVHIVQNTKKKA